MKSTFKNALLVALVLVNGVVLAEAVVPAMTRTQAVRAAVAQGGASFVAGVKSVPGMVSTVACSAGNGVKSVAGSVATGTRSGVTAVGNGFKAIPGVARSAGSSVAANTKLAATKVSSFSGAAFASAKNQASIFMLTSKTHKAKVAALVVVTAAVAVGTWKAVNYFLAAKPVVVKA